YVFTLDAAKKAQMRPVKVLFQDQAIAALGSGVEPHETVITDGQLRVSPGITVSILGENPEGKGPAAQATKPAAEPPQGTTDVAIRQGAPGCTFRPPSSDVPLWR